MKEAGVSEKDPEYQRLHQQLSSVQRYNMYNQQRVAHQKQQHMLNQQQNANTAMSNGVNGVRPPSSGPAPTSQAPLTCCLLPQLLRVPS